MEWAKAAFLFKLISIELYLEWAKATFLFKWTALNYHISIEFPPALAGGY